MEFLQRFTSREVQFKKLPSGEDSLGDDDLNITPSKKHRYHNYISPCYVHLILLTFNVFLSLFIMMKNQSDNYVASPASEAITYENIYFNASLKIESPFTGEPRPELDQAWSDLLQYSSIAVSGDDLSRLNKTSIPIPGAKDSYWVDLSVTHELHCIKRLYQFFHRDYYFPDLSPEDEELNYMHTDHCLEILRQASMCHGDISLIPMHWNEFSPIPEADFSVPHKCVNWEKLRTWTRMNSVDVMRPNFLKHPSLGPSFPDGSNHGVGVEHKHSSGAR
ncbi:hypothetical protein BO70DRAFT_105310 [Aspergillus heteromorphus CBS 117.55]|uniref:Tat pathway signal sequence n=1 Tax=Aspergillus heteromorphus CBS 117.55 TaxID=1448321 RepID=A0A317VR35_9EURO|nr:uncharacterized protein BO70DRAFT_105310 [Aspergillus heteromorphus CBS 117.55]PWY74370.1 hypothetical protein BO70DRAFT_105310 [Aspergillus heteromorphus CBS 117.55]